jgi:hypothetical protein
LPPLKDDGGRWHERRGAIAEELMFDGNSVPDRRRPLDGFTASELLFVVTLMATMTSVSVPPVLRALDDYRAAGAARYVAARLQRTRMEAVLRSADVGTKFVGVGNEYSFRTYIDGNRNGISSTDIQNGVDRPLGGKERLTDYFTDVDFGTMAGLPAVDSGSSPPGSDPIHLGTSDIATFSANGSSSTGSLYVRSRTKQYVVRIYGDTGKTRLLVFDAGSGQWRPL